MPRRIHVLDRIIQRVRVSVQRLRIPRVWDHRIRADEPPNPRVVIARAMVHQPRAGLKLLSGEGVISGERAVFSRARRAVGVVRLP